MSDETGEARQVTQDELISLLEGIQEEVRSGKVRKLCAALQIMISQEIPSPYISTATIVGKQLTISLAYEE